MRILAVTVALAGCSLYFSDPPPSPAPQSQADRDWNQLALPILRANCVECHGRPDALGFLAGTTSDEIRQTLLSFDPSIIDLGEPTASRLLSKGIHSGPSLTAQETSDLLTWIEAERAEPGN